MKQILILLVCILSSKIYSQNVRSYVPTNGLIAWYPFTGNAIDSSGNGNNASVIGATLTTDRFNHTNSAYDFTYTAASFGNQNDDIYIPYNSIFNSTNISVSVWIYLESYYWPSNSAHSTTIIARYQYGYSNPNGQVWQFSLDNNTIGAQIEQASTSNSQNIASVTNGNPIPLNQWSFLVFTYNGTNLNLYLNGALVGSTATTLPLNTAGNSGISIGELDAANGDWYYTDGIIDDIGIWNRALTPNEITELYLANKVGVLSKHYSATQVLKDYILHDFKDWIEKDEFETKAEYQARLKKSADRLKEVTNLSIKSFKDMFENHYSYGQFGMYDAENETFQILFDWDGINPLQSTVSQRDTILIKLPREIARICKYVLGGTILRNICIIPQDVILQNDQWVISKAVILFDNSFDYFQSFDEGRLSHKNGKYFYDITNYGAQMNPPKHELELINIKTTSDVTESGIYFYEWKISDQPNYDPEGAKPISFSLQDLNITIPSQDSSSNQPSSIKKTKVSDNVDKNTK